MFWMSKRSRHAPYARAWRRRSWWALAAALLVVAAISFAVDLRDYHGPSASDVTVHSGGTPDPLSVATSPVLERSAPVAIRIPAIGVEASVTELGLNADNTVEVPTDFQQAGWYKLGPSPGELGSAVILGHVDSYRGPAVFFRLRRLQPGDEVEVSLADGQVARFAVTAVATYPKDQFPTDAVYGSRDDAALQLVTCGGEFDTHARSYLSNVVVYTTFVGTSPRR